MFKITIVCIPTLNNKGILSDVSMHFGKTPYFVFIELEDDEVKNIEVVESFGKHKGGSKTPAEIILNSGADLLICGNLGSKAVYMLQDSDIEVFSGSSGTVKDCLKAWKMGLLQIADENSCTEKSC